MQYAYITPPPPHAKLHNPNEYTPKRLHPKKNTPLNIHPKYQIPQKEVTLKIHPTEYIPKYTKTTKRKTTPCLNNTMVIGKMRYRYKIYCAKHKEIRQNPLPLIPRFLMVRQK